MGDKWNSFRNRIIPGLLALGVASPFIIFMFQGRNDILNTEKAANPSISAKVDEVYTFYEMHLQIHGGEVLFVPTEEADHQAQLSNRDYIPDDNVFKIQVVESDKRYYTDGIHAVANKPHSNYALVLQYRSGEKNFWVRDRFGDGMNEYDYSDIPTEALPGVNQEYGDRLEQLTKILHQRYNSAYFAQAKPFPREYWNAGEIVRR